MLSDDRYSFFLLLRIQNISSCGWLAVSRISTIDLSHLSGASALVGVMERLFTTSFQTNVYLFLCTASCTLAGSCPLFSAQYELACTCVRHCLSHPLMMMGGTLFSYPTTWDTVSIISIHIYSLQLVAKWEHTLYALVCLLFKWFVIVINLCPCLHCHSIDINTACSHTQLAPLL